VGLADGHEVDGVSVEVIVAIHGKAEVLDLTGTLLGQLGHCLTPLA
jgi:hypothetical protein